MTDSKPAVSAAIANHFASVGSGHIKFPKCRENFMVLHLPKGYWVLNLDAEVTCFCTHIIYGFNHPKLVKSITSVDSIQNLNYVVYQTLNRRYGCYSRD